MEMDSVANLGNIADHFSDFFPFKKAPKPSFWESLILPRQREVLLSQRARTHLSLSRSLCVCSVQRAHTSLSLSLCVCSARGRERSSALIQLNTDIMLLL